jgi:Zn-dependent protease with chaperone function
MRHKTRTLGSNDDPLILVGSGLVDGLSEPEMLFVLGRECGHIQNRHTTYLTCLHFLVETTSHFVRWVSRPATVALNGWSRRAAITADRAGLLCARDLDLAVSLMVRTAVGSKKLFRQLDLAAYLQQLEEGQNVVGRLGELLAAAPDLPKRVQALRLFARTSLFLGPGADGAMSREDCDTEVGKLLALLR